MTLEWIFVRKDGRDSPGRAAVRVTDARGRVVLEVDSALAQGSLNDHDH
jgi:hypothetical protein